MTRLPVLCLLLLAVLVLSIGCGGSGENPSKEKSNQYDIHDIENPIPSSALDVKIEASKTIIKSGEVIEIKVKYTQLPETRVLVDWINVTEFGELSDTEGEKLTWTAPDNINTLEVIEIIHTVVTGVSRMISTDGLDTRTKILTETKTILLTVTGE
tara:strand:+ start:286 stop:753 length:468 start_codon:yes stop_codon:yes gene_type:complete